MEIYEYIGIKIRELREQFRYSQDVLAQNLKVSTNTVSRWETAKYKPSVMDLQKIADLFKIKLSTILPPEDSEDPSIKALLSATGDLPKEDIDELIKYAEFKRDRRRLDEAKKQK